VKVQVRQANKSLLLALSSRGKSRLELDERVSGASCVWGPVILPFRAEAEENLLAVVALLFVFVGFWRGHGRAIQDCCSLFSCAREKAGFMSWGT
jgi:hypothetical protein